MIITNKEIQEISFDDFLKVRMLVGTIQTVVLNAKAKKPAYKLSIDFGSEGIKWSSAQLTVNYSIEDLIGRQIIAVVNFPIKRIAGVKSEVLILAAVCEQQGTILIEPNIKVLNGTRIL